MTSIAAICLGLPCVEARGETFAYVANNEDNTISVIDVSKDSVVASIPVRESPHDLVVTSDGETLVVTHYASSSLTLIDTRSRISREFAPTRFSPEFVVSGSGSLVYVTEPFIETVCDWGLCTFASTLNAIDVTTATVLWRERDVPAPGPLAVARDGDTIFALQGFGHRKNRVLVFDSDSAVLHSFDAPGFGAVDIAAAPSSDRFYIGYVQFRPEAARIVALVDRVDGAILASVSLSGTPLEFIESTTAGDIVYAVQRDRLFVLDVMHSAIVDELEVGSLTNSMAIVPNGSKAYLTSRTDDIVIGVDPIRHTRAEISVGHDPYAVAVAELPAGRSDDGCALSRRRANAPLALYTAGILLLLARRVKASRPDLERAQ